MRSNLKNRMGTIISVLGMVLFLSTECFAYEFKPAGIIKTNLAGIYLPDSKFVIYESDDASSTVLEKVAYDNFEVKSSPDKMSYRQLFAAYDDNKNTAVMFATDETDEFVKVIYNQAENKQGWIKKGSDDQILSYAQFLNKFGRKNGITFLYGTPEAIRKMKTAPSDDSQDVQAKSYAPKLIKLQMISGNWMMIKLTDYDGTASIGWIKWRDSDGNIFVFPLLDSDA